MVDPQAGLVCNHFIHPPQGGYLCLPLTVQGETLGVLTLTQNASRKGKHPLGLKQLAVTVGETIKLSLSNLKLRDELRQQAIHDPLTDLFNRRYLEETLPRDLYQAQRRNAPLCVVMLDLDGFKQFNDSFGHGAGDALLREFGGVLREHLRKSDISCRYGGDEFLLVMPDSSIADTQERLEQIRIFLKRTPNYIMASNRWVWSLYRLASRRPLNTAQPLLSYCGPRTKPCMLPNKPEVIASWFTRQDSLFDLASVLCSSEVCG